MMTKPFFSIITVTKNNLNGLQKTYTSILEQSFTDYEWIVQDGGSEDGTADYIIGKGANFESAHDHGIYDAMNKAMARAEGFYLVFMNAGDSFAAAKTLEKIENKLAGITPEFAYGDSFENGHLKRAKDIKHIMHGMITHHQAMIYHRKHVEKTRYNLSYGLAADYDFTLRATENAAETTYLDFPVCHFEAGGASQKRALQGRSEQFKIRQTRGYSPLKNTAVFIGQSGLHALRSILPGLYWILKSRRKPYRNNRPAHAQSQTQPHHPKNPV